MRPTALAFILLTPALRADGLADLQSALKSLPAKQPVNASVDCQVWSRGGKAKQPKIIQGRARVVMEDGPAGLKLGWNKAELDRIQAATKAKDDGPQKAMSALGAEKAATLLDTGKELLNDLDGAAIQEDRADTFQGRPARLLVLKLDAKDMDEDSRKHLKSYSRILKIWMGGDGIPLGLSEQMDMKLSVMFIGIEMHHNASRAFVKSGDRLVTIHDESQDSGSGLGESGEQKTVMDLKL